MSTEDIFDKYKDISKEELKDALNEIISKVEIGKNYEIKGKDFTLKIKPTNSSFFYNSTHVYFEECEKILRKHYNISNSSILSFVQLELDNDDEKSFINQVEYQTFNDKKEVLDLSLCKDVNIQIHHSIKEGINLNKDSISEFNNSGINIFDIKDNFFNDICNSYSNTSNDIILHDRIKYIYQNYSLCNQECIFNNIDLENMTILCDCSVKQNLSTELAPLNLQEEKESSIMDSNIGVIRCYHLVFSLENKLKNVGFLIFVALIIINTLFLILYYMKGIKSVLNFIFNEMVKYGYLRKNNKFFFEDKSKNYSELDVIKKKNKKRSQRISNPLKINKKDEKDNKIYKQNRKKKKRKSVLKKGNISQKNDEENSKQKIKLSKQTILNGKNKKRYNKKLSFITTGFNGKEKSGNEFDQNNFSIIRININNIKKYTPQDSFQTLYNYSFEEAIEYDRRSIFKIFYIYLLSKQIIFHTFFQKNPLEIFYLRISLLIFMLSSDLALNSLFYLNDNISKKI